MVKVSIKVGGTTHTQHPAAVWVGFSCREDTEGLKPTEQLVF